MPTANTFSALGKGNGFPFTCNAATDSVINAFDGHEDYLKAFVSGAADTLLEVYRVREVSLTEAMGYIWNLYEVSFANFTETSTGDVLSFSNPSKFKYNTTVSEGYVNADEYTPIQRVCNEDLGLPIPRNTYAPFNNGDGGWFVAEADDNNTGDTSAQFAIRSIYYATDTNKYYIIYTSSLRADDDSFIEEMPFSGLTFDYYTYN